jgi:hypothetical protein
MMALRILNSLSLLTDTKKTYRISAPSTTSSNLIFKLGSNKGERLQKHRLERQKIKRCQQLPILECAFERDELLIFRRDTRWRREREKGIGRGNAMKYLAWREEDLN